MAGQTREELIAEVRSLASRCKTTWPAGHIVLFSLVAAADSDIDDILAVLVIEGFEPSIYPEIKRSRL